MKKLLLTILVFFTMVPLVYAVDLQSLKEKVKNYPDVVQSSEMGEDIYHISIKENISNSSFDWRFDMRMISVIGNSIIIGHREEQNTGNHPDSNWVIEYTFVDKFGDGTLNGFSKERFISIEDDGFWFRVSIRWPDGFRYPYPTDKEKDKLYEKELEYWENKL